MKPRGAGVLVVAKSGEVLLLKRSRFVSGGKGKWAIPGGKIERGEKPLDAALREFKEEVGWPPRDIQMEVYGEPICDHKGFLTFRADVTRTWEPRLNWEHTASGWFRMDDLPGPMLEPVWECLKGMSERRNPVATLNENGCWFFVIWPRIDHRGRYQRGFNYAYYGTVDGVADLLLRTSGMAREPGFMKSFYDWATKAPPGTADNWDTIHWVITIDPALTDGGILDNMEDATLYQLTLGAGAWQIPRKQWEHGGRPAVTPQSILQSLGTRQAYQRYHQRKRR